MLVQQPNYYTSGLVDLTRKRLEAIVAATSAGLFGAIDEHGEAWPGRFRTRLGKYALPFIADDLPAAFRSCTRHHRFEVGGGWADWRRGEAEFQLCRLSK